MLWADMDAGFPPPGPLPASGPADRVGLSWLVAARWALLAGGVIAVLAGTRELQAQAPIVSTTVLVTVYALSNIWLTLRIRRRDAAPPIATAGLLASADMVLLSWLLARSGGILNPASAFYLVEIVLVALVLGRRWTWIVTSLSVAGYAALFLDPTEELRLAQGMHPGIALHMRGMWMAFAGTALIIAALVTRLLLALERRDRALAEMREHAARATRVAGLATLAAGAAHELSTPLSTIAVAARELEHTLADRGRAGNVATSPGMPDLIEDARLIRAEADQCRRILDAMAGRSGDPSGQRPSAISIARVLQTVADRLQPADRQRLTVTAPGDTTVVWPEAIVARALGNIVQNALQAAAAPAIVRATASVSGDNVSIAVVDSGPGMSATELSRAGEPFFTTKPAGVGTGLGLFVARSSVEQLGGQLLLRSAPGAGTTATILLPRDVVSTPHPHG
jgi:two-component system sensor histidine kinase RegB